MLSWFYDFFNASCGMCGRSIWRFFQHKLIYHGLDEYGHTQEYRMKICKPCGAALMLHRVKK